MVDMDDLPDEGGPQPVKTAKPTRTVDKASSTAEGIHPPYETAHVRQNVPKAAPTDDLPDEGGQGVDDYPDKNLIEDEPTPEQAAGADCYTTLEGVESELRSIADSLEIGAWEGQDEALRVQIKSLQAIRQTLNGVVNRGDPET